MRPPNLLHAAALAVLAVALATTPAAARTWVVRPGGSIQGAIDRAGSGDVILILPGEYREGLVIEGKRLTLRGLRFDGRVASVTLLAPSSPAAQRTGALVRGEDAGGTVIRGLHFDIDPNLHFDVALLFDQPVELTDCTFDGGSFGLPGFAAMSIAEGAHLQLAGCRFHLWRDGIVAHGSVDFDHCEFVDCDRAVYAVAPCAAGETMRFHDVRFDHCRSVLSSQGCGDIELDGCEILACGLTSAGLPVIETHGEAVSLTNSTIRNSGRPFIPVILLARAPRLRLAHCTFEDNDSYFLVSGASGVSAIEDCRFLDNQGGLLFLSTTGATFHDCLVRDNAAPRATFIQLSAQSGAITLSDSTWEGNDSNSGLISVSTAPAMPALIANCLFVSNTAEGRGSIVGGAVTVADCRIVRNTFAYIARGGRLERCLVAGNTVRDLLDAATDSALVGNTVLRQMHMDAIGCTLIAIHPMYAGRSTLRNCIVRDAPMDQHSTVEYCNIEGGPPGPGNINADPLFVRNPSPGPDQTWGTPDDDYGDLRLQPGSPCIDAADSTAFDDDIATDLDGSPRFVDDPATPDTGLPDDSPPRAVADMGAFEFQPDSEPPAPVCDVDLDGKVDVRDLLRFLHRWTSGDPAADLDGNGEVEVFDLLEFLDCFTNAR